MRPSSDSDLTDWSAESEAVSLTLTRNSSRQPVNEQCQVLLPYPIVLATISALLTIRGEARRQNAVRLGRGLTGTMSIRVGSYRLYIWLLYHSESGIW
jgi:hypothetical protein